MQITVACHRCEQPKRPLSPCPACAAAPLAELELQAWRLSLHAHHLARITRTPRPWPLPALEERDSEPIRAVLLLDRDWPAAADTVATIVPTEPPVAADDARSFDWEDERPRRLRRSA